ncbi:MAG: ABC transporter transmembrane domain-containing protein, partial [Thiovulaceae bacterium]|nr:ABC transporter transmembrane domain-containing protein [Sulfurimonadaceae bacterium]
MKNKAISLKSIFQLILSDKKTLVYGQILTILAILVSVPIPLMLPMLIDEVLLDKPAHFVSTVDYFFTGANPFIYIAVVTLAVIFLRFIYYFFTVLITKIFTQIAKYVTFKIRQRLLEHLKISSMNEYETLGSGAITANLVTDVNTLDSFIMNVASKLVASVLMLLAVGAVMIMIDPIMGLLILIIQPVIMLISKNMSKKVGILKKQENAAIEKFQDNIGETLELYGQIKASNKE